MLTVVALGGNALLRRDQRLDFARQRQLLAEAARSLAALAEDHQLVITHGNGPQIGYLALQGAAVGGSASLDVLGAETEGMIGYLIEQELRNQLPGREVATLLTQTLVDPADRAFQHPTKLIGPVYRGEVARQLAQERGWQIAPDGPFYRRVVPSPEPQAIVELPTIRLLVNAGVLVIAAGGGGIPITLDEAGGLRGVEAVVDKDLTSALLAEKLGASRLLLLTDISVVERDWGTSSARPIWSTTPEELRALSFESGTMAPKVAAACRFVEATGKVAIIGALDDALSVARGEAGTVVRPAGHPTAGSHRR